MVWLSNKGKLISLEVLRVMVRVLSTKLDLGPHLLPLSQQEGPHLEDVNVILKLWAVSSQLQVSTTGLGFIIYRCCSSVCSCLQISFHVYNSCV